MNLLQPHFAADGATGEPEAGKQATPNAEGNGGEDKQAELNRQFAERAERAEKAERKKLFEALGVKDEADFEAYVKAKKEADDSQKSELQKLTEQAQSEKLRADKLESETNAKLQAAQTRVVNTEIKLLASAAVTDKDGKVTRAAFRPDALDDVAVLIDRAEIKDEDGKIVGIDKALDALAKAKPWLLAEGQSVKQTVKGTPQNGEKPKTQTQDAPIKPSWTL